MAEFGIQDDELAEGAETVPAPAERYTPTTQTQDTGGGLLAALQAEAATELSSTCLLRVRARPGWVLEFDSGITQSQLKNWENRAGRGKGQRRQVDVLKQSGLMLVEQSVGVHREGQDGALAQVMDPDGDPLTLTSDAWLDLYPGTRGDSLATLRQFAGDAGVLSMAAALVDEAGWGDAADTVEDPTQQH